MLLPRHKRGRPTAKLAAEISEAILASATELFLARGYEATTMEAVAAAAGVPKSTLYKRHGDKLSLLRTVVEARLAAWTADSVRLQPSSPESLEQCLRRHAESVLLWADSAEVQALSRMAAGQWQGAEAIGDLLYKSGFQRLMGNIQRDVQRLGGQVPAPVRDPRFVATILMSMTAGWLVTAPRGANLSREDRIAFADRAVDLLIHGRQRW
jgi:TetR/AcrR family transcriptional regulator, mexJK operon transcriptional repressor